MDINRFPSQFFPVQRLLSKMFGSLRVRPTPNQDDGWLRLVVCYLCLLGIVIGRHSGRTWQKVPSLPPFEQLWTKKFVCLLWIVLMLFGQLGHSKLEFSGR